MARDRGNWVALKKLTGRTARVAMRKREVEAIVAELREARRGGLGRDGERGEVKRRGPREVALHMG